MELLLLIMILISTFFSWKDYRSQVKKAETVEDVRKVFVRFILSFILLILAIIVFIF